jgi:hypothetical protein
MSARQKRVLWPVLAILSITVSAFVYAGTRGSHRALLEDVTSKSRQATSESASGREAGAVKALNSTAPQVPLLLGRAEIVRFTVYEAGIRPNILRASPGLVEIHIEDLASISAGLVVQRESGSTLGQVVRAPGRWRGSVRMLLEPGRYRIYDATRPRNSATLIVQP